MGSVYLLNGLAGAGKDQTAKYLVEQYGFKRYAFADKIREALYILNPLIQENETNVSYRLKTLVDEYGWDQVKREWNEARYLLQTLGTEVGREQWGENFWANQVIEQMEAEMDSVDKWVITDWRFQNEADAILDSNLPDDLIVYSVNIIRPGVEQMEHKSETQKLEFDILLNNDGTLEDLYKKVDKMIRNEGVVVY